METLKKNSSLNFIVAICIEKDGKNFHAFCPGFKGIHVDGRTEKEAVKNAKIAIVLYLKSLIKHKEPIPLLPGYPAEEGKTSKRQSSICHPQQIKNVRVAV